MSDLISRQEAIEEVIALPNTENGYSETYDKECIIGLLKEIPSAEPKKGKWKRYYIERGEFGERPSIFYCSECHSCSIVKTDFCPNCGTDMMESD